MKTKLPFYIFLTLSFAFLFAQFSVNVIALNYYLVHLFFGFAMPFLAGFFPAHLFRWNGWSKLPLNHDWDGYAWSPKVAVAVTLIISLINEAITDPKYNGIPFSQAWHHFAIDIAGMVLFAALYLALLKPLLVRDHQRRVIQTFPVHGRPQE